MALSSNGNSRGKDTRGTGGLTSKRWSNWVTRLFTNITGHNGARVRVTRTGIQIFGQGIRYKRPFDILKVESEFVTLANNKGRTEYARFAGVKKVIGDAIGMTYDVTNDWWLSDTITGSDGIIYLKFDRDDDAFKMHMDQASTFPDDPDGSEVIFPLWFVEWDSDNSVIGGLIDMRDCVDIFSTE
ncbi:MAG: hypothetical protein KAS32_29330 [Candidatus Peribacteraceae bacterium]|nr:hypothetical protein [Candidatus Peribacteraceae bacterium]